MPLLATIGYEGASLDGFIAALIAARVDILVDVRAVPWSRRSEFAKPALSRAVAEAGLSYRHMAALGNPKRGREAAKAGHRESFAAIYAAQLATPAAEADLAAIAALAATSLPCLMCYEKDPASCHRSMIADRMAERYGMTVKHLAAGKDRPRTRDAAPRQGTLALAPRRGR